MRTAWVIGGGGLLGSAIRELLRREGTGLFTPSFGFRWTDESAIANQFALGVREFSAYVREQGPWEIYWAAGVGNMGSPEQALVPETAALSRLLWLINGDPVLSDAQGAFAFASSAGAIYAAATTGIVTEETPPTPTTDYARAKLTQEGLIRDAFESAEGKSVLIARISTLYGPGQSQSKQQGLITHIARSILRGRPVKIYVPLDTIRDYIYVSDAAAAVISAVREKARSHGEETRIIAAEQPTTIAEIVSTFKTVAKRNARVITSINDLTAKYPRKLQFRSILRGSGSSPNRTSLLVGISRLMNAEKIAFTRAGNGP